jgi:uncharacterized Zn finger protein
MKCPICGKEMMVVQDVELKTGGLHMATQAFFGLSGMPIGDLAKKLKIDLHFCLECGKVELSINEETKNKLKKLSEKQHR